MQRPGSATHDSRALLLLLPWRLLVQVCDMAPVLVQSFKITYRAFLEKKARSVSPEQRQRGDEDTSLLLQPETKTMLFGSITAAPLL